MDNLQVLHNKAAKFVLNLPNRKSSTKALTHLSWKPLSVRRKIHRCTFVFRAIQSDKEQNPFIFLMYKDKIIINTTLEADWSSDYHHARPIGEKIDLPIIF